MGVACRRQTASVELRERCRAGGRPRAPTRRGGASACSRSARSARRRAVAAAAARWESVEGAASSRSLPPTLLIDFGQLAATSSGVEAAKLFHRPTDRRGHGRSHRPPSPTSPSRRARTRKPRPLRARRPRHRVGLRGLRRGAAQPRGQGRGRDTYGKGLVQSIQRLTDGGAVVLTVEVPHAAGEDINGRGSARPAGRARAGPTRWLPRRRAQAEREFAFLENGK